MGKYKISVCISVHNTAKYLPRCLDSVVNQTVDSLQIVLVNNGSTDESETIMKDYQKKYTDRDFVIISQNDRGLAQGRQSGIDNACGDYLAFLDADDYIEHNAYEEMMCVAEKTGADIIECETIRGNKIISSPYEGVIDAHDYLRDFFWGKKTIYPMVWMRVYKRELFHTPVMPELYVNNEDIFAFPCLLYAAKTIAFVKKPLHVYSIDNDKAVMIELSKKRELSKKYYDNRKKTLYAIDHIKRYFGEAIETEYKAEFNQYIQRLIVTFLFADVYNVDISDRIRDVKEIVGFNSEKEVISFIQNNTHNKTIVNIIIRILGIKNSFKIKQIKHKFFKRT